MPVSSSVWVIMTLISTIVFGVIISTTHAKIMGGKNHFFRQDDDETAFYYFMLVVSSVICLYLGVSLVMCFFYRKTDLETIHSFRPLPTGKKKDNAFRAREKAFYASSRRQSFYLCEPWQTGCKVIVLLSTIIAFALYSYAKKISDKRLFALVIVMLVPLYIFVAVSIAVLIVLYAAGSATSIHL